MIVARAAAAGRRLARDRWLLCVVAAFALSRIAYSAAGVSFDASPLGTYWQFIDPELLRDDLFQSLWYVHTQPPLFDLYLGAVLNLAGGGAEAVFEACYLGLGLALAVLIYRLARRLGASGAVAGIATILYTVSPPVVLYENWLYMEQLAVVCLLGGALLLHRYAGSGRTIDLAGAFALFTVVVFTRPLFHLVWLVGLAAIVWSMQPGRRTRVLAVAALPLCLTIGLYVKNLAMFDTFSAASCPGINAYLMVSARVPEPDRVRLIDEGKLSRWAVTYPIFAYQVQPELFARAESRGVALLDRPEKTSGHPNVEHSVYLDLCSRYMSDALTLAREQPSAVARGLRTNMFIYWRPASQYEFLNKANRRRVDAVDGISSVALFGQLRRPDDVDVLDYAFKGDFSFGRRIAEVAWFVLAAHLAALALALVQVVRAVRTRRFTPLALVSAYLLLTMIWVMALGIGLAGGENNRFRFLLDPLVLAYLTPWVTRMLSRTWPT